MIDQQYRHAKLASLFVFSLAGCAQVALQGGDKPIHIIADVNVNVSVSQDLNNFFAFEEKRPSAATAPSTQPI